jgi:hypothetical protein
MVTRAQLIAPLVSSVYVSITPMASPVPSLARKQPTLALRRMSAIA